MEDDFEGWILLNYIFSIFFCHMKSKIIVVSSVDLCVIPVAEQD